MGGNLATRFILVAVWPDGRARPFLWAVRGPDARQRIRERHFPQSDLHPQYAALRQKDERATTPAPSLCYVYADNLWTIRANGPHSLYGQPKEQ